MPARMRASIISRASCRKDVRADLLGGWHVRIHDGEAIGRPAKRFFEHADAGCGVRRVPGDVTTNSEWLIRPDGSELHELVPRGAGAAWSGDGRWLY